nr:immunoglobulin light chain junction region [Macaca mulatta]
CQRYSYSPWTF